MSNGECKYILDGHTDSVYSVEAIPEVEYIISGSKDKTIRVWNLEDGKCIRVINGHSNSVHCVI